MLESNRSILFVALALLTFLLYQKWQDDYQVKPGPRAAAENIADTPSEVAAELPPESDIPVESVPEVVTSGALPGGQLIEVITDTLQVKIDTRGGDLVHAALLKYPEQLHQPDQPMVILNRDNGRIYEAQSGLLGKGAPDQGKRTIYSVSKTSWQLQDGDDELKVQLDWTSPQGVTYKKIFTFHRGHYLVHVDFVIDNNGEQAVTNRMFSQLKRDREKPVNDNQSRMGMQAYIGAAYGTTESRYKRYEFDDMDDQPLDIATEGGWIAYLQHYFISAWVPDADTNNQLSSQVLSNKVSIIRVKQPWVTVQPGSEGTTGARFYVGPKAQERLEDIAPGLDLTVDYGFLWWIGKPLFWLLKLFYSLIPNWGIAIILVTIAVKLLFYPLSNAQYRSMAKMRTLQPKMQRLKERYGEDRQKMSQAMMEMYKKEKVNPLGGCLPMLIMFPVFIALYWVLLESVELRHAPFFGWIQDLSVADPWYILPVAMGASMWLTQKMQPMSPTMDPTQQKIMQFLPVIMTAFFLFFPAGLVLYWLTNNLLTIAQQYYVNQKMDKENAARAAKRK